MNTKHAPLIIGYLVILLFASACGGAAPTEKPAVPSAYIEPAAPAMPEEPASTESPLYSGEPEMGAAPAYSGRDEESLSAEQPMARITSYNVCYTKLLR